MTVAGLIETSLIFAAACAVLWIATKLLTHVVSPIIERREKIRSEQVLKEWVEKYGSGRK